MSNVTGEATVGAPEMGHLVGEPNDFGPLVDWVRQVGVTPQSEDMALSGFDVTIKGVPAVVGRFTPDQIIPRHLWRLYSFETQSAEGVETMYIVEGGANMTVQTDSGHRNRTHQAVPSGRSDPYVLQFKPGDKAAINKVVGEDGCWFVLFRPESPAA